MMQLDHKFHPVQEYVNTDKILHIFQFVSTFQPNDYYTLAKYKSFFFLDE